MGKISKGDIIICSTDELPFIVCNKNVHLIVGDKYVVRDIIEMSDWFVFDVEHLSSSKRIGLVHDRHFITLDVWRHFQLEKILN